MRQNEFSVKTKLAAWERSKDAEGKHRCDVCRCIIPGRPEYDHIKPVGLGGNASLANCQCICSSCHRIKTHDHDRPVMTKADNQRKSGAGIKRKYQWGKRPFGGWQKPATQLDPDT